MIDLRKAILTELEVSRNIVRDGHEVVPRFVIFAPDGAHSVMVQLPDAPALRAGQFWAIRNFMIWKAATAFILAGEIITLDAISAVAITRMEVTGARQLIRRELSLAFDEPEWFGREDVADEILSLLPPRGLAVSAEEARFIKRAFEDGSVRGITWHKAISSDRADG